MAKYQGVDVKSIRPAVAGDPGFDASKGAQVVIVLADGSSKTVLKSETVG